MGEGPNYENLETLVTYMEDNTRTGFQAPEHEVKPTEKGNLEKATARIIQRAETNRADNVNYPINIRSADSEAIAKESIPDELKPWATRIEADNTFRPYDIIGGMTRRFGREIMAKGPNERTAIIKTDVTLKKIQAAGVEVEAVKAEILTAIRRFNPPAGERIEEIFIDDQVGLWFKLNTPSLDSTT